MVYGRLDVFYSDGRVESFLLEKPTVSIGRASGNVIVLDDETISRYHASITAHQQVITLVDLGSENGTFVDGIRLKGNAPYTLTDTEELLFGTLRVVYHPIDETVTSPISAEETQPIPREERDFSVKPDFDEVNVWPASSTSVEVAITNHAPYARLFFVTISGLPTEWIRLNRPTVEIQPNDTTYVLIHIKPPRRADIKPQAYRLLTEVTPAEKTANSLQREIAVNVRGFVGLGMALSAKEVSFGERLTLYLHNQGSEDLTLVLSAKGKTAPLQVSFSMPRVTLGAGERSQVAVRPVPTQRALTGKEVDYPFYVIIQAQNASRFTVALNGILTVAPRLPQWAVTTAVSLAIALLALVIMGVLGMFTPTEPRIDSLETPLTTLAQGDELELSWQAEHAERFQLIVNDALVDTLDSTARTYRLPTDEISGSVTVEVLAEARDLRDSERLTVFVYRPIISLTFNAEPPTLVRRVITPLTLIWDVPNAVNVRLEGLASFTTQPLPETYESVGNLNVVGYAESALTLTLYAEDEIGTPRTETLTLALVDAICTTNAVTPLYQGADVRYAQVSQAEPGVPLVVIAQDTTQQWLQVSLTEGVFAWLQKSAVTCGAGFSPSDLYQEVNMPPLPEASPTGTPTPSPTVPASLTVSPTASSTP